MTFTRFEVLIDTTKEAFHKNGMATEVAETLRAAAGAVEELGSVEGPLKDLDGNEVGHYRFVEKDKTAIISEPGADGGPCWMDCGKVSHPECREMRATVAGECNCCGERIGYNRRFVAHEGKGNKTNDHATCAELAKHAGRGR